MIRCDFSIETASLYTRFEVSASSTSATATIRARKRDVGSDQSVGVAGTVKPFMVMPGNLDRHLQVISMRHLVGGLL